MDSKSQQSLDNHSRQCNPSDEKYGGYSGSYEGAGTKADLDNHANQMNPNNAAYSGGKSGHSGGGKSGGGRK